MGAVEWAFTIVLSIIGIVIAICIMFWGLFSAYKMFIAFIAMNIIWGPPVFVLVVEIWFAESLGGPVGGVLVLLTVVASGVVVKFWWGPAEAWIEAHPIFKDWDSR